MSADDLASKLSQSGIPQSNRSTIINSIIKHLVDSGESEGKGSTNNSETTGDTSTAAVADAADDIPLALSNIGQLSPGHPLVQRIQRDTGIQDPQIATQYTQKTLSAMKEHANENPERIRSLFRSLRLGKEVKDQGQNSDGSFLHDGYDSF
jgi:hypothetical protein